MSSVNRSMMLCTYVHTYTGRTQHDEKQREKRRPQDYEQVSGGVTAVMIFCQRLPTKLYAHHIYTFTKYVAHETQTAAVTIAIRPVSSAGRERSMQGGCVLFLLGNRKPGGTFIHSAVYTFRSLCGCPRIPLPSLFSGLNKRNVPFFGCAL